MKTHMNTGTMKAALAITMATAGTFAALASTVTLSAGNVIPVNLDSRLTSDHSQVGDKFTATIQSGYLNLPKGTKVQGVVRKAVSKTDSQPGMLELSFTGITLPNGRRYTLDGSPSSLDPKSVTTKNGRLIATPGTKSKRLTYIGYGAGAGVLYSVLHGGRDILKDTLIGAGAGLLGGALEKGGSNKKNNVLLQPGIKMGVLLHKSRTLRT